MKIRDIPIDAWKEYCECVRKQVEIEKNKGTTLDAIMLLENRLKDQDIQNHPMRDAIEMCLGYAIDQLKLSLM